jgi:hypothetical protein
MSDEHVADIAETIAGTVRVRARDVRVGDLVFSTSGKPDKVIRATHNKRSIITPEKLWPLVCDPDDTVTIFRLPKA